MSEEQKTPPSNTEINTLDKDQLQSLVKQTLKENKILVNKNSKLETKYVELFKQHRLLKKDHTVFVSFFQKFINNQPNQEPSRSLFQQQLLGQYELAEIQKLVEQKLNVLKQRICELQNNLQSKIGEVRVSVQKLGRDQKEKIISDYESRLKANREEQSKQMHSLLRDIQSLKKVNKRQGEENLELKQVLETKGEELSKLSKEKLKLEHHLNNIRKKEIKEELSPQKEMQEEKMHIQRNQFLSLRQQVESLLAKRDQLKRELKELNGKLEEEKQLNQYLSSQVSKLNKIQSELDEKYQLIRECTFEELENLILNHQIIPETSSFLSKERPIIKISQNNKSQDNEKIQRQYFKNVIVRYIKAEVNGKSNQSLTLLQIIGTLLKLDNESIRALDQYKLKRKQWWNLHY